MALEDEIKKLNASVQALTDIIGSQNLEHYKGKGQVIDAEAAEVPPESPEPEKKAPATKKKAAKKKAAPKKAESEFTIEQVREVLKKLERSEAKEVLSRCGTDRLSELKEDLYKKAIDCANDYLTVAGEDDDEGEEEEDLLA
jgi:hypothetical protein